VRRFFAGKVSLGLSDGCIDKIIHDRSCILSSVNCDRRGVAYKRPNDDPVIGGDGV